MAKTEKQTYSRRNVIAGLLAAPVAVAAPVRAGSSPISVSDDLAWMIDLYAELYHEADHLDDLNEAIVQRPDFPLTPAVNINEVSPDMRDYWQKSLKFESHIDLDRYYSEVIDAGFFDEEEPNRLWRARVERDWDAVSALLRSRTDAAEEWLVDTGLKANERRIVEIGEQRAELRQRIADFPCRTIHDVLAKIEFSYTQVEITRLGELQLVQTMTSMRHVVEANCRPIGNRRQPLVS